MVWLLLQPPHNPAEWQLNRPSSGPVAVPGHLVVCCHRAGVWGQTRALDVSLVGGVAEEKPQKPPELSAQPSIGLNRQRLLTSRRNRCQSDEVMGAGARP